MKTRALALLALLCVLPVFAHAGDVTVSWTNSTTCADGSPLSMCPTSGIEVLKGATLTDTAYTSVETLGATATTKTYSGLTPGQVCYSLKTVSGSQKSAESTRACVTVPSLPPKAPAGITVTVNVTVSAVP